MQRANFVVFRSLGVGPIPARRRGRTLPSVFMLRSIPLLHSWWHSSHLRDDGNVELRIKLHAADSILASESLHHGRHLFGVRDGNSLEVGLGAPSVNSNRRVLEHVLVPLCFRSARR